MSTPTYNKMASIAIGGTNINKVSTPNGNSSLDVSGQTNLRNNLYVAGNITNSTADMTISTTGAGKKLNLSTYNDMNINSSGDMYLTGNSVNFTSSSAGVGFASASNVSFYSAGNIYYQTTTTGGGTNFIINDYNGNSACMISATPTQTELSTNGQTFIISNAYGTGTNNLILRTNGIILLNNDSHIYGGLTVDAPIIANYIPNTATSNTMIGYTNSISNAGDTFSGTASDTATPAQVGSFTLPCKGVWFIQMDVLITLNTGSDTITDRSICLSETSASLTECAPGFKYSDPIDDGAGSAGNRQTIIFSGIYHLVSSSTKPLYVNAIVATSGSRTVTCSGNYKYTRIA